MDSGRKQDSFLNSKHAEKISAYRIMDDEFMSKVFDGHKEATELVLKIILKKNDLNVILPETYVIFITETDVLQKNLPIYHVERKIKETEEPFNDNAHIIYVNGQNEDKTDLGLLMHDFRAENPDEMHYKLLADRVRVYKETEEGVNTMNALVEQYGKEEAEKATDKVLKSLGLTPKQYEKLVKEREQNPDKKIKLV